MSLPARNVTLGLGLTLLLGSWSSLAAQATTDRATVLGEALTAFRSEFMAVDRSYSTEARAQAEARLATMEQRLEGMSDAQFQLALAQVSALADNGHSLVLVAGESAGRVGIRLAPFGSDFHVLRASAPHSNLLGGRLVAIDDVPIAAIRDSAHSYFGGTPAHRDRFAPLFIEAPMLLHAAGITRNPREATFRFTMPDGTTRAAVLGVVPAREGGHGGMIAALNPAGGGSAWTTLLSPDHAPWALQEFATTFRRRDLPELNAIEIQLRANVDAGGSIAAFLEASDSVRRALGRTHVVLDMRFNGGGNLQLTREFMSALPERLGPNGRVVVLTSPWTFSAAISSIGYLKQAGGDRVVIVGEEVGDRLEFWAEGGGTRLPTLQTLLLPARERHDYRNGCRAYSDCHPPVVRMPIAVASLSPDVVVPWTLADYAAGKDAAMEAAARVLGVRG